MRRWLAVAALGTAFLALPAWGQRGGGRASGGFAGHAGFSGGGHAMAARGFPGVQRGNVNLVIGGFGYRRPGFGYRRGRYGRGWPYGWYGYPYYGWGYGDDSYSSDSSQSYPVYDYSNAYAENDRQQAAIDRLEAEVDRLREEREAREAKSSNAAQTSKSAVPPTELVFRDKHTEEVQNYAIVGQTFWILNAEKARKFPIAQLDIPATQKANEDRGVDFQLPE
jgi:hypothetical protein